MMDITAITSMERHPCESLCRLSLCVCVCVCVCVLSRSVMSHALWPHELVAFQAPLFVEFFKQEYWSGLPFSPPGDLANPGIEPESSPSPALAGGFFITDPPQLFCRKLRYLIFLSYLKAQQRRLWCYYETICSKTVYEAYSLTDERHTL